MRPKFSHNEEIASKMGYEVIDGVVYKPNGEEQKLHLTLGYPRFSIWLKDTKKTKRVSVHRLVALQKYGNKIYQKDIDVRHLDENKLNFLEDNIDIGTRKQNYMDIPKEKRIYRIKVLHKALVKYSDEDIKEMFRQRVVAKYPYSKIASNFTVSSKSNVRRLLLTKYTKEQITIENGTYSRELVRQVRKERFELGYSYKQIIKLHDIPSNSRLCELLHKRKLPEDTNKKAINSTAQQSFDLEETTNAI